VLTLLAGLALGSLFNKSEPVTSVPAVVVGSDRTTCAVRNEMGPSVEKQVFSPREVTQKALILSRPEPLYTESARANLISGTVVLRAILSSTGTVTDIKVVSGLPYGLTERAVEAAQEIKFNPAIKDGRRVSQYIQIEYNFHLY
jgi:TonB family protein